jgi:hypothetical protein
MISLALSRAEIMEIIGALTDNGRYASPALVAYLKNTSKKEEFVDGKAVVK